ncbi:hypothetical protein TcCL_NonESM04749 [Trypanosoma cruzi]|nr:hypothetical protein TcCL_NonESM04749 [Trypanosoma cruzi]
MTLPLHRSPKSVTDHPLTKEKAKWSGHCSVRATQQKHPQRTNALECPSEGASGLAVKPTDTGEPPALHASNDAIERSVTWHINQPVLVLFRVGMTVLPSPFALTKYSTGSFEPETTTRRYASGGVPSIPHKIKCSHVEDRSENEHNDEQHEGCLCSVLSQHSILRWFRPLPHDEAQM